MNAGARRLIREFRAHLGRIAAGMAFLALSGAFSAGVIAMVQPIFDELLNPSSEGSAFLRRIGEYAPALAARLTSADRVWVIPAAILVLVLFGGLTNYQGNLLICCAGQNLVADLRARLFRQITRQDLHFFTQFSSGILISRVISDLERLQQAVSQALGLLLFQSCVLIILMTMAFWREPLLTLLIAAVIPVVAWPLSRLGKKLRRASAGSQERTGSLAEVVKEAIAGREVVRVFQGEAAEEARFGKLNDDLKGFNMRSVRVGALSVLMEMVGMIAICGFLVLGFHLVHERNWTLGAFAVYLALLWAMYEPVKKISRLNPVWQNGLVSAERAFAVLDVTSRVEEPARPLPAPDFHGSLRFEGVTFAYPGGPTVLGPMDLEVKRAGGRFEPATRFVPDPALHGSVEGRRRTASTCATCRSRICAT